MKNPRGGWACKLIKVDCRLENTAFCHIGSKLIKVDCRYLSACGKHLQHSVWT